MACDTLRYFESLCSKGDLGRQFGDFSIPGCDELDMIVMRCVVALKTLQN